MTEQKQLQRRLELIWWVFTLILVVAVMSPIWINQIQYPFKVMNVLYIVLFVTLTRHLFLLKHTLLARKLWLKVVAIAVSGVLVFVLATSLGDFNNFIQEKGLQELMGHLPVERQYPLMRYVQTQAIFFGVGSAIAAAILPIRMIISIWRIRNTPTGV